MPHMLVGQTCNALGGEAREEEAQSLSKLVLVERLCRNVRYLARLQAFDGIGQQVSFAEAKMSSGSTLI